MYVYQYNTPRTYRVCVTQSVYTGLFYLFILIIITCTIKKIKKKTKISNNRQYTHMYIV